MDINTKNDFECIKLDDLKSGEKEALIIMINKGYEFDMHYYDDNSKPSMPDLKFLNGRYLEVTHTKHNNEDWNTPNKFFQMALEDRMKINEEARKAYERLLQGNYENNEKGILEEKRDNKIVKSHYGYDFETHKRTEFGCDLKGTSFSQNNVLDEIITDKGEKYPKGNVDLFIFVIEEELNSVLNHKEAFLKKATLSPFKTVYLCVWDMFNNQYETKNPKMVIMNLGDNPPSIHSF